MTRPRVLVVDQNDEVRDTLVRMLRERGYTVHAAENRSQGFDLMDELTPDLLILDDPGKTRTYRLVWLHDDDQIDTRVELVDLQPESLGKQLGGLLDQRSVA